jgi:hypothetical protein
MHAHRPFLPVGVGVESTCDVTLQAQSLCEPVGGRRSTPPSALPDLDMRESLRTNSHVGNFLVSSLKVLVVMPCLTGGPPTRPTGRSHPKGLSPITAVLPLSHGLGNGVKRV